MSALEGPVPFWPADYAPPAVTPALAEVVPVGLALTPAGESALDHDLAVDLHAVV